MSDNLSAHIYLEGLPALIVQFGHLLLDPCWNIRDSHVDDIFQEDGKVLQGKKQSDICRTDYRIMGATFYFKHSPVQRYISNKK